MPLSPAAQRERRSALKKFEPPKKFPKRRCKNCDKKFERRVPHKKFCCVECKNEYGRYGSAFGPLKDWLTKLIEKHTAEKLQVLALKIEGYRITSEATTAQIVEGQVKDWNGLSDRIHAIETSLAKRRQVATRRAR